MNNLSHIVISAILSLLMLKYVIPKMIYWMCEMILQIDQVIELSKGEMKNRENYILVRLVFGLLYLASWGAMIGLFIPMQILNYIEILGGVIEK